MSQYPITSQRELRAAFWKSHRGIECRVNRRGSPLRQNEQSPDTRTAWVDYVDAMQKNGQISVRLSYAATL